MVLSRPIWYGEKGRLKNFRVYIGPVWAEPLVITYAPWGFFLTMPLVLPWDRIQFLGSPPAIFSIDGAPLDAFDLPVPF